MLAKITSGATVGLDGVPVTVEVDIATQSLPAFTVVGLPDKAVEESRERVRSALKNSGAFLPPHRITVNLAPADLPKEGPQYDVPIAVGILAASGQIPQLPKDHLFFGELSLDGTLCHTNGILSMALLAKEKGFTTVYIPAIDVTEAAIVGGITVYPVVSLPQLVRHLMGAELIEKAPYISFQSLDAQLGFSFDMADIHGQEFAKRAAEIAAAGNHNLFLSGVPGAGKTLLARTLPSILPDMTETEALEVTKLYSITGNLPAGVSIVVARPFRAPHHTTSRIGLIGGGSHPLPGEISLAHRGVLFLDEFPEFPRHVLEAIRQPLEDHTVTISRAKATITYPAQFLLVAAANPCPCGYYGDPVKRCHCMPGQIDRYQKRISGPILDRIDLHVGMTAVEVEKLTEDGHEHGDSSEIIQKRVQRARDTQRRRFVKTTIHSNAEMRTRDVKLFCPLSSECLVLLRQAVSKLGLSARSYYKVIKVARTIADLEGVESITPLHIAESLQYRPKHMID